MICSLLFTDASHKYFASSSLQAEKREHGTDPRAKTCMEQREIVLEMIAGQSRKKGAFQLVPANSFISAWMCSPGRPVTKFERERPP